MQLRRVDSRVARDLNREFVFRVLRAHPVISRTGLGRETGLSKATISQIVEQFSHDGLIEVMGQARSAKGRRPTILRLNPQSRFVIGVELGAVDCRAVLTDLHATPLRAQSLPVRSSAPEDVLDAAVTLVQELRAGLPGEKLLGIGIGSMGMVDSQRGVVRRAGDVGWRDVAVGPVVAARCALPTLLVNRGKAAAVGEAWSGAARGVDSSVCLYVSTGISAGIVIGRELYRGRSMSEGEIGHTTVLPDGPLCVCGNRGCLRTVAAAPAILAHVRECQRAHLLTSHDALLDDDPDSLTLEAVGAAAAAGNPAVLEALDGVAKYLGIAVANLVDILDPQMIVLGGPAILALPMLVPRIDAVVRRRAVWVSAPSVQVLASQLGKDAVAIGAAAYLLSHNSVVAPDTDYSVAPTPSALPGIAAAPKISEAEPRLRSPALAGEAAQ